MKKLFVILLSVVVLFSFAACKTTENNETEDAKNTAESSDVSESTAEQQSDYVAKVFALKGPTGMGMSKLFSNEKYEITLASSPDEITGEIIAGRFDIAAVPTNLAATLYNKTEGALQVVALNTLGVLYILENGETIKSVADLEGKTIGATGQGSTPEYILNYILALYGLKDGENITVEYYADHSELMTQMVSGNVAIGMLPEPNVSIALSKAQNLRIALNLTEIWEENESDSVLTQGCIIASKDFIENHPNELASFLTEYKASVEFVNSDIENASALIAEIGIVTSAEVAKKAIPNCNICFISGDEMKTTLSGFLQVLYDANPKAVGGKMPDDAFYYIA